jgi:hypothetical protein
MKSESLRVRNKMTLNNKQYSIQHIPKPIEQYFVVPHYFENTRH